MRATLRDVAELAEVHPGTVSRALNPDTRHLVNEATAKRVEQVADELGYGANSIARGLQDAPLATRSACRARPDEPALPVDRARDRGPRCIRPATPR